jgi:hypothetical protein
MGLGVLVLTGRVCWPVGLVIEQSSCGIRRQENA